MADDYDGTSRQHPASCANQDLQLIINWSYLRSTRALLLLIGFVSCRVYCALRPEACFEVSWLLSLDFLLLTSSVNYIQMACHRLLVWKILSLSWKIIDYSQVLPVVSWGAVVETKQPSPDNLLPQYFIFLGYYMMLP